MHTSKLTWIAAGTLALASFAIAQPKPQTTASAPAAKSAFDKKTLEAYLRHLELWLPQVEVKIEDPKPSSELPGFNDITVHLSYNGGMKDEHYLVSKDGKKVLKADVYDIDHNPFQSNLDKLKTDMTSSFGTAGAPVVLVIFSDFQCPLCKEEAQILRANLQKTFADKVRVYFKDFPIDNLHNWARAAAIAGRCVARQNAPAFWKYFDWVYENQSYIGLDNINNKVMDFAAQNGLDGMQLSRCIDNKATEPEVNKTLAEGHALGVDATPTMYLNGRKLVGNIPWQSMEQLINIELDHQAKAGDAGEQCCTVMPKVIK
jgi:protein-disulfide isomerase